MPPKTSKPKNKKVVKKAPATSKSKPSVPVPVPDPVETVPVETVSVETVPVEKSVTDTTSVDPVVSETPYVDEFKYVVEALDSALMTIRGLKSRVQKLEKRVHKDHKVALKKMKSRGSRKPRDPNAPKSGFAKEGPVSDEMRKFLGLKSDTLISRTDVTRKIHEYCKSHNLQNPSDKRKINADASLKKLLKMSNSDELTFFNLQKYMKVHFPNKEGVFPTC